MPEESTSHLKESALEHTPGATHLQMIQRSQNARFLGKIPWFLNMGNTFRCLINCLQDDTMSMKEFYKMNLTLGQSFWQTHRVADEVVLPLEWETLEGRNPSGWCLFSRRGTNSAHSCLSKGDRKGCLLRAFGKEKIMEKDDFPWLWTISWQIMVAFSLSAQRQGQQRKTKE